MRARIISGVVGTILLAVVVFLLPPIALNIATALVCSAAMYELLVTTNHVKHRGVLVSSILFAACTPFFMMGSSRFPAFAILLGYVGLLTFFQIIYSDRLSVEQTSFAFFMSITFPVAFSCLAYLRTFSERDGLFYLILGITIPWMSDMGAYFVGTLFGKHKLCPKISPKKTIEGLVGGLIISVLSTLAVGWIYQAYFLHDQAMVNYMELTLLAIVCAPLSVLGDLFASIIKRQCHVKDFGKIMPGHGGIMDRFDSLMLVVPLLFILVHYIPLIY